MSTQTQEAVTEHLASWAETINDWLAVEEEYMAGDLDGLPAPEENEEKFGYDSALEVITVGDSDLIVVFTIGGPHVEYSTRCNELTVRWGAERGEIYPPFPFRELVLNTFAPEY
jgi:hypothetical protein